MTYLGPVIAFGILLVGWGILVCLLIVGGSRKGEPEDAPVTGDEWDEWPY